MRLIHQAVLAAALSLFCAALHAQTPDLADRALILAFQRDKATVVCSTKSASLKEMREQFNPYIKNIDLAAEGAYSALAKMVYTVFPCPFSPYRAELRAATSEDIVGTWLVPMVSGKLRFGPKSRAWSASPGVPPIKCEGIAFHPDGEYRVMQVRGDSACPDMSSMQRMRAMARVSSWSALSDGRIMISRTGVPSHFEEWEVDVVLSPFEHAGVHFEAGDLAAYLRREPGNDINAATVFRHLQRLH